MIKNSKVLIRWQLQRFSSRWNLGNILILNESLMIDFVMRKLIHDHRERIFIVIREEKVSDKTFDI